MTPVRNLYVHVPFCARRCVYCDFAVEVDRSPDARRWTSAVARELAFVLDTGVATLAPMLETLYVGGGTPSLLGPGAADAIARVVAESRLADSRLEWTMEANPESFTREVAKRWAARGVNRVSLGVQSFSAPALKWMGRLHAPAEVAESVVAARRAGVSNISVDLLFGLPGDVRRSWKVDMERALALDVPHVSIYGLAVEDATPLARAIRDGRIRRPRGRRGQDEYLLAAETLAAAGYEHYEVSNFARPGFASRHNRSYWNRSPYLGIGNGAHSCQGRRRSWNVRDWRAYAEQVARTGSGRAGEELLSDEQARLEDVWLGLRTSAGVHAASLGPAAVRTAERWRLRGLARFESGVVRLAPEGWLHLDDLAVEMDLAAGSIPFVARSSPAAQRLPVAQGLASSSGTPRFSKRSRSQGAPATR